MKQYNTTIIGFGITGMLVLAILKSENIDNICIIDPYFDGGDLLRLWGDVLSNTSLQKTIDALKLINPTYVVPQTYAQYDVTKITPLYVLVFIIKDFLRQYQLCTTYETKVQTLEYNEVWTITNEDGTSIQSKTILCCQGSEVKKLQCGIPSISLNNALNKDILKKYIKPADKVLVFGTAHSGALVLENLHNLGVETTAVYKGDKPFSFASEGEYDGIKEEAERIGRSILDKKYNIQLIHLTNVEKIIKASKEATWVIYAIGFESRSIKVFVNNKVVSLKLYDSKNGLLSECPKAYGFGIAYPSLAPDNIHVDVGIYSFVEHIQKQIPNLKSILNR